MFVERIGTLAEEDSSPLYQQLQRLLRSAIERHVLAPDEALPPERDLATAYNVSRVTVRKAIDGLVDARLLTRKQGAGTFVAARVEKNFATISSFTEDMRSRGRVPHSEWLARTEGTVTPEEAMALGLSPGSPVFRFIRIRYADGISMALEYATVPASSLASPESVTDSLYDALGPDRPVRVLQRFRAVLFTDDQAELLKIDPGTAGLEIERRGYTQDGRTVELTKSWYRGDTYDFVAELSVAPT
jgi:GntR family transcriptional regulator